MMARLRLTAVESTAVVVDDTEDLGLVDPDCAFVGKVLAPNKLHVQTIASALRPAWGNPKGLTFNPSGDNLFVAEFGSKADRDRVMEASPWTVGRHAVLMKKYDTEVQPQLVVFDRFAIWARILALPNRLMNSKYGLEIAKPIGLVKKVECDDLGRCWGAFMRLRTEVKVDEPLLRVVTVFSSKLQTSECFAVQYEKLPIYCFSCGLLGHSTLMCSTPAERDENDDLPYSAKKLLAPEEHKKSGGSWSGNASARGAHSASGSKNSTAGSASTGRGRPKGGPAGQRQGDEHEVSSPSKAGRGPGRGGGRGSRGQGRGRTTEPGRELFPANSSGKSNAGLKRKAVKVQNVQGSAPGLEAAVDNSRALVVSEQAVANGDFTDMFEECSVENIIATTSDHYAILISLAGGQQHKPVVPVMQGFRYEAMWRRAEDYTGVVEGAWAKNNVGPNAMQATCANLSRLAVSLKDWSHTSFGSVQREIKRLETALWRLCSSPISDAVIAEEKVVERLLCELFEREEIMARQRSRVDWLREGDHNTAFFHAKATTRKKANRIASLQRENGTLCSDQEEIKGMVHGFYEDLFTAEPLASMDIVLEAVPEKVKDYCWRYAQEAIIKWLL
ncbi:hypothetical protein ACQ4PT_030837 [Festuca glaucescens]